MNIPYVGIDANAKLEPAYQQMIRTINPDANVKLLFQPSETVDFSKFTYDLVMTSPPYFMIEEYEKMPAYKSKEGFLQKFFIPVVEQSWKYLLPGGHMALNMPHEMYMAVRHILPLLHKRMLLPLHNRHPTNAVMKQTIGSEKERHEIIYVWKKGTTGRTTRKKKRVV
jgi:DNA modification methylase